MSRCRSALFALFFFAVSLTGTASGPAAHAQTPECFDAEATVRIVRQTPTVAYHGTDYIVMRWPWIVDLEIRRVHWGELEPGPITVLTLQHTDLIGAGEGRWLFRRNAQGGFNSPTARHDVPTRCPANAPLPNAFIVPADGQTLEDLRREGEAHYGRDPAQQH